MCGRTKSGCKIETPRLCAAVAPDTAPLCGFVSLCEILLLLPSFFALSRETLFLDVAPASWTPGRARGDEDGTGVTRKEKTAFLHYSAVPAFIPVLSHHEQTGLPPGVRAALACFHPVPEQGRENRRTRLNFAELWTTMARSTAFSYRASHPDPFVSSPSTALQALRINFDPRSKSRHASRSRRPEGHLDFARCERGRKT